MVCGEQLAARAAWASVWSEAQGATCVQALRLALAAAGGWPAGGAAAAATTTMRQTHTYKHPTLHIDIRARNQRNKLQLSLDSAQVYMHVQLTYT